MDKITEKTISDIIDLVLLNKDQNKNDIIEKVSGLLYDSQMTVVSKVPTRGLLISMALREDHSFGMPYDPENTNPFMNGKSPQQKENILISMKQLHEEVVGTGFYSPDRDEFYLNIVKK